MGRGDLEFPLYQRAEQLGVLNGRSALIIAPTATGKSHIGREAVIRALRRGDPGIHAYLVPFRSLADEVFESFLDLLQGTDFRVRISTGDYRDPVRPEDADLVIATYESFAGLMRLAEFRPGLVVADEIHLVADETRGAGVEGLFARLMAFNRLRGLCGLSAVVDNGPEIADWLGVPLLVGTVDDRPVPLRLDYVLANDLDQALAEAVEPCRQGEQALVFCSSRGAAEKTARWLAESIEGCLSPLQRRQLHLIAEEVLAGDPDAEDVVELLPTGVAYHHAGLPKPIRRAVEQAFRQRLIRIIASTPTLAAGVNLPAGIAVVHDVFRREVVRGSFRRVLISSGEVLNMLGRAARPHQVDAGVGIALVEARFRDDIDVQELLAAVRTGVGGSVASRLDESFEGLMRFCLAVVVERGEAARHDLAAAYSHTLAQRESDKPIGFDRPFKEDLLEDVPAFDKVRAAAGSIRVESHRLVPEGIRAVVRSSGKSYEVTLGVMGLSCDCPAASRWRRGQICKHVAAALHDLIFGEGVDGETRDRAIYVCGHVFSSTLDVGTRITQAMEILDAWGLVERIPGGWRSTPVGGVALASGFDLLLVSEAVQRVAAASKTVAYPDVARWAVIDYFPEEKEERWLRAIDEWVSEVDAREMRLPEKYRGDFEARLEDLARVCLLYRQAAEALGRPDLAEVARQTAGVVRYGVAPELVPLMGLGLPQLARARSRYLYERGIRNLSDLASADPEAISHPRRAPAVFVRQWVERAREIHQARATALADRDEAAQEFDELVARFRLDPAALG